jgi:hypothetical protein
VIAGQLPNTASEAPAAHAYKEAQHVDSRAKHIRVSLLICLSGIAVLFDVFEQGGTGQSIATIPEFLRELSLGIYLTVKGFRPSPVLAEDGSRVLQTP